MFFVHGKTFVGDDGSTLVFPPLFDWVTYTLRTTPYKVAYTTKTIEETNMPNFLAEFPPEDYPFYDYYPPECRFHDVVATPPHNRQVFSLDEGGYQDFLALNPTLSPPHPVTYIFAIFPVLFTLNAETIDSFGNGTDAKSAYQAFLGKAGYMFTNMSYGDSGNKDCYECHHGSYAFFQGPYNPPLAVYKVGLIVLESEEERNNYRYYYDVNRSPKSYGPTRPSPIPYYKILFAKQRDPRIERLFFSSSADTLP